MSEEHDSGHDATLPAPEAAASDYPELVTVSPDHYILDDEIARGGMGRIRVARDRRLGRRIALKEILVRRADLARRFEREARITARLEHPAIVSVHEAGSWPSGEPFIAMRLVNGRSLDEVIAGATTLEARLALLPSVLAVADAIAYAHGERVIHRDLKPKNVLVGSFGETVVIDWGLAKDLDAADDPDDQASPPETANDPAQAMPGAELVTEVPEPPSLRGPATTGLTVAGAVMGTPAYMPPEQARGDRVDERADVYAIGAILYHTLAGRVPVAGKTPEQVVAAVLAGKVSPLVEAAPDAPTDLLAIVAKAMAPELDDRYPTARELADDLRRFQTGQLVGAHRYSAGELIRKWIRRHRTAVVVGAIAAAVLVVAGVLGVWRIVRERERAEAARASAEQSRADAEELVGFMLGDLRGQLEPLGRLDVLDAVTRRAVEYYERRAGAADRGEQAKRASALVTRGAVHEAQGNLAAALEHYRAAIDLRRALAESDRGDLPVRSDLAAIYRKLSDVLRVQGDAPGALAAARDALAIAEELVARDPDHGAWRSDLAGSHKKVGDVLRMQGDDAGALAAYRDALAIRAQIAAADPDDVGWQRDLAINHERVGGLLQAGGDLTGALAQYRAGLVIIEGIAAREPDVKVHRRDLAIFRTRIGDALLAGGDTAAALAEYRAAQEIPRRLAQEDPLAVQWQRDLSISHGKIGEVLLATGDSAGALVELRADLAIAERLARLDPSNAEWQRDLSVSHERVGDVHLDRGELRRALVEYRAGLAIAERLAAQDPSNTRWQEDLVGSREKVARAEAALR